MAWTIEERQGVAVVWMQTNPINSQNQQFFKDLHEAFNRLETIYPACPVVLTSAQRVFSAGLDFEEVFAFFATASPEAVNDWFQAYRAVNLRVFSYPRPTVAAINGSAIAGGLITALACDYRIVADGEARLGLNEIPVGIPMPSTYIELIRYAIGSAAASVATLFGHLYTVRESQRLGFVHEVIESAQLVDAAVSMAASIPSDSMEAFACSKRALQAATLASITQHSPGLDRDATALIASPAAKRARAAMYEQLKGFPPPWRDGDNA